MSEKENFIEDEAEIAIREIVQAEIEWFFQKYGGLENGILMLKEKIRNKHNKTIDEVLDELEEAIRLIHFTILNYKEFKKTAIPISLINEYNESIFQAEHARDVIEWMYETQENIPKKYRDKCRSILNFNLFFSSKNYYGLVNTVVSKGFGAKRRE